MFNSRSSPPPLQHSPSPSDLTSSNSWDTAPVTPVTLGFSPAKRFEKPPEVVPWFQRPPKAATVTTSLTLDSSLIDPDFDENTFPLFGASPRRSHMAVGAPSDDQIPPREPSTSPRGNQASSLTAAFKQTANSEASAFLAPPMDSSKPSFLSPEHSDMSRFENGARPISVKGRPANNRRESLAQSIGMGMSWGGVSVGSWIRDE